MSREAVEALRRRAARLWAHRFAAELQMAERFRILAQRLAGIGASRDTVDLARHAEADELRHADLCTALVHHFGGAPLRRPSPPRTSMAPAGFVPEQRVLYDVVAMACITETLSTALLGALVEGARDSLAKQTMRSILRDEVRHGRLGWRFLAERQPVGTPCRALGGYLPAMLDATLSSELFQSESDTAVTAELIGLGELDRQGCRRIVRDTLERVVFPGLERYGIDVAPGRRWLDERDPQHAIRG